LRIQWKRAGALPRCAQGPFRGRRQEGVAARLQAVRGPVERHRQFALDDEEHAFGAASGSGRSLPPPGSTSMMYCEKVSAKPDSGRAITQPASCPSAAGSW
jgi:hypothetical protein